LGAVKELDFCREAPCFVGDLLLLLDFLEVVLAEDMFLRADGLLKSSHVAFFDPDFLD
jgi:hypothetical protein